MIKLYYIIFDQLAITHHLYSNNDKIILKRYRELMGDYIFLIESENTELNLDNIINYCNSNWSSSYTKKIVIEMVGIYKGILRDDKIKNLISE